MLMKSKIYVCLFLASLAIILSACQTAAPLLTDKNKEIKGKFIPSPEAGMAVMTGKVLSSKDGKQFSNVPVRLAQIYRKEGESEGDGAFVLDIANSPSALSEQDGT